MKTSAEIEAEFRKEFQALIDKYKAEIEIKDYWQGYSENGQDIKCMVSIGSTYNDFGERVTDFCEFNIGTYHYPCKLGN